jgi:hypothetical protein
MAAKRGHWIVALAAAAALAGCGGATSRHKTAALAIPRPFTSDRSINVGHVAIARDQGTTVASDGFVPTADGFSFENYGFIAGTEIDQHDLREMFGDQVCADAPSDACTLTPSAQQFAQQVADGMLGGHCFGFAVTAWRFLKHDLSQGDFGGTSTFSLSLTPRLVSEIAYGWAMQLLPSVQAQTVRDTPTHEIAFLTRALANAGGPVYTIGIHNSQGGHAVTPIAIDNLGGGQYQIVIYDNNFPGVERTISVDTNADSWSYNGAPNPTVPPEIYSGQGTTNPIELIPLAPGLGRQPCPFCGSTSLGAKGRGVTQVSLGGNPVAHGHLLITTADGRHVGYLHGRLVNEVKGARLFVPLASDDFLARPEPIYQLPAAAGPVRVTLDGSGANGRDAATMHITGPGFGATISNLRPQQGSVAQFQIAAGGRSLSLRTAGASSGQRPVLQLAVDQGPGGSELTAAPQALPLGVELTLALDPSANHLSVRASAGAGTAPGPVSLQSRRVGAFGSRTNQAGAITLTPGRAATFSLDLSRAG